ncbi:MAG: SDR family oxidoreductase [Spongiibacteraceae bacterium]
MFERQPPPYPAAHDLLSGKRIVITAAAGVGIGFAIARRCMEEGATVMISDVRVERLSRAAQSLRELTDRPAPFTQLCDVSSQQDVEALFAAAQQQMGGIDVVMNNAGIGGDTPILAMADAEWQRMLDVTLTGTFRMTREAFRYMQPQGSGVIVNNASFYGWRAVKGQAHYAAAKAGVMALTRCAAVEGAEFGVRVNAVAPSGAIHDKMREKQTQQFLQEAAARMVQKRPSETWEVATVMVFLASEYSSYMTGEILPVSDQHA